MAPGVHPKKRGKNAGSSPWPVGGGNSYVENVVIGVATHPGSLVQCSVARKNQSRHSKWDAPSGSRLAVHTASACPGPIAQTRGMVQKRKTRAKHEPSERIDAPNGRGEPPTDPDEFAKRLVGKIVTEQGSIVRPGRLRFSAKLINGDACVAY
jgi:hypothetical protein